jgi:hypothetical protein
MWSWSKLIYLNCQVASSLLMKFCGILHGCGLYAVF